MISALIAAFAGTADNYWFYWRTWSLGEALAYLTLAPVILTGSQRPRSVQTRFVRVRKVA